MKKPWESFEKNYVAVETTDERTGKTRLQYEYCGPWFVCQNGKAALNRAKGGVGAALIVSIVCVLWAGIQPSQLNRAGLTCVPYGLSLAGYFLGGCAAALIYFVFKALRYREEKNTDFEYEKDFLLGNSKIAKQ